MKYILNLLLLSIAFSQVAAQWTTSGNIVNTNVGAVSVVRNTGFNNGQIFIVNPKGQGNMTIGEPNTGAGGHTALSIGISAAQNGHTYLQAIKSAGSSYGVISLNPSGGNVGIGTETPGTFKLAVEGKIGAREVQVTLQNPWPDYVFAPTYKLMDLQSLQQYISQYGHLPGISSAKEIEAAGGVELGKTSAQLLEKIEELTLHILELNTRLEELEKKNVPLGDK